MYKFYNKIEWLEINAKGNKLVISYVIKKDKEVLEGKIHKEIFKALVEYARVYDA